jgi:hypothetical protein
MRMTVSEPLGPGLKHLFHLRSVNQNEPSVDYICGENILLHIKLRAAAGSVVLNDFIDRTWRDEVRVEVPPEEAPHGVTIVIAFTERGATVTVGEEPPIAFDRGTDLADVQDLRYTENVKFDQIISRERTEPPLRRDAVFRQRAVADASLTPKRLEVRLLHADITCFRVEVAASEIQPGVALLALVDGRECGRVAIEPIRHSEPRKIQLVIPFAPESLVAEGMVATLAMEEEGTSRTVGSGTIRSILYGGLDRCSEQLVRGWACNPEFPDQPMAVDIFLGDAFQGTALANRPRNDLRQLGDKYAQSGFLFRFPKSVFLPESSDTFVSVRFHNTDIELDHSPWFICRRVTLPRSALITAGKLCGHEMIQDKAVEAAGTQAPGATAD